MRPDTYLEKYHYDYKNNFLISLNKFVYHIYRTGLNWKQMWELLNCTKMINTQYANLTWSGRELGCH